MKDKHYIGDNVTSFKSTGSVAPVDGVILKVDEETAYMAGDQTGYVLELECPYGTQAMADSIMAGLQGKSYEGYEAEGARLPLDAELGDGVTVRGMYSPLFRRRVRFGGELTADISAPSSGDLDHEFGFTDPAQRKIELAAARLRSYVDRTTGEIRLGVEALDENVRAELALKVGKNDNGQIVSMLNASADEINIRGNRFVLDSDNFKVAADGTVVMKGADVSGRVRATSFSLNDVSLLEGTEKFTSYEIDPEREEKIIIEKYVISMILDADNQIVAKGYLSAKDAAILKQYSEDIQADKITALRIISGPITTYGPITVNGSYNAKGTSYVRAGEFFGRMHGKLIFTGAETGSYDGHADKTVNIPRGRWEAGDTLVFNSMMPLPGMISSSATAIQILLPLGKPVAPGVNVSVSALSGTLRGTQGYIEGNDESEFTMEPYTVSTALERDAGLLRITIQKSSAFTNVVNNTPVSLLTTMLGVSFT